MKSKLLMFIATLVASACAVVVQAQNAIPYLPQKVDFGGTSIDVAEFFASGENSYTLEVDGTAGTEISIVGGGYSYIPEATGKIRFSQRNGKVYVYEGNKYKTTLTSVFPVNFPVITDENVVTNAAQLLKNCSFETTGDLVGGSNYKFGEPWLTNVIVAASGGIRVGKNTNAKNGEYAAIWRGSGNTNYFAQPVTGLKPNTYYKIQIKQVDGSNAFATFNVGFGSTVNGMEYGMKSVVLGSGKNNTVENPTWNLIVKTPSVIGETAYFTFANTASNTSSAGSDPLTQIDYISVVEGSPLIGITGAVNPVYLADVAYAPEMTLSDGDYYDMTSYYVVNPNFSAGKTGWTENYVGTGGDRKQNTVEGKVCWNSWSNSFTSMDINQTLKGLPAGLYSVSCLGLTNGGNINDQHAYAVSGGNTYKSTVLTSDDFKTWEKLTVGESDRIWVSTDGELTIGFASTSGGGTKGWFCVTDYSLSYYGYDASVATSELTKLKEAAEGLLTEKMSVAVKEGLTAAITAAEEAIVASTQEKIDAATALLLSATEAVNVSIAVYTSLNDAIGSSNTNKANYTELPGYADFEAAIAVAQGVYDAATTDSLATAQAITTLKKAEVTCRLTQVAPADFSWIIVNPNADDKYNGWTTTGMVKGPATGEDWAGTTNPYFDGGNYGEMGWTVTMSQTIEGLPAGKYTVKAVTRASTDVAMNLTAKTNAFHAEQACVCVGNTGGSIFDNAADGTPEKTANGNKGFGWTNSSVNITVNEGSPLIIGMTATTAEKSQWFSIDQFELVYNSAADAAPALPANVSEIEAGKEYVIQLKEAGKILTAKDKLPVVNKYQDGKDDAFTFVAEKEGEDTYKFKQKSTGLYVAAVSNSNWDMTMTDGTTADITGFKVTLNNGVYSISSMKNTDRFVGLGNASEETLYFDKGSDKPHSFIVMDAPEYFTYATDLVFSETRAKLLDALKDAVILQDETAADDRFSQEAKAAYAEIIDAAGKVYEEATETEALQAAVDNLVSQLHVYLTSGNATEENPIDFTRLVINPTMTGSTNGWTSDTNAQNKALASNKQGAFTGTFLENWLGTNISGKIWQKITGLPKGKYILKAAAFTNTADKEGVSLYINEEKTSVTSVDPAFYTVTANVMGNTVEIGLSIEPSVTNWVGLDNVTLSYCGYGLSSITEALQAKVEEAEAMGDAMQNDLYEALATAVTAAKTALGQSEPVQEDLEAALAALETAIANATPSVAAYAKLTVAIDAAKAASVAAKDPVPAAIDAATTVYTTKEADVAGITEAIATLRKVVNTAIVANATDGDVTEMIINPGFEEDNANGWMFNPEANTGAASNKEYEIFAKLYDMYQTITEVPAGVYQLQVQGFHRAKANDSGAAYKAGTEVIKSFLYAESDKNEAKAPMMSLYAEEGTGTLNGYANSMAEARTAFDAGKYAGNTVNMIAVANDTLSIGIKYEGALEANSWTIFDNFKLIYLGTEADIMADVKAELTDSIAVATGLKEGATKALIVKAEMNKLVAAVDAGNTAVSSTVLSEMNDALTTLKVAITDARTSIGLCTDLAALFTEATTLIATYKEAYDPTALQAVLDKNLNMYQNQTDQTDNAALVAAKAEMEAALTTYKETVKSDVDVVNAESIKVYVDGASIVVDGADNYDIYTEGGILVNANTELVPGIYIVKVAGQTVKIQVK